MARKSSINSPSLPLDVFHTQITQFKRAHIIPRYDDSFEKDAIISALKRIDPSLPNQDANIHAHIILQDKMTSPEVTPEDIQYAVRAMSARHTSPIYQFMYAMKYLWIKVISKNLLFTSKYWGRLYTMYRRGKFSESFRGSSSYTSLLHRV